MRRLHWQAARCVAAAAVTCTARGPSAAQSKSLERTDEEMKALKNVVEDARKLDDFVAKCSVPQRKYLAEVADTFVSNVDRYGKPMPSPSEEERVGKFLYRHSNVHGNWYPVFMGEDQVDGVWAQFQPRPTDVFICSYPKSGTTWVQNIVRHLLRREDELLSAAVPWLEATGCHLDNFVEQQNALNESTIRAYKTHAPRELFHPGSRAPGAGQAVCKVIYVARNPKDTAVSLWHHARGGGGGCQYRGPWAHFLGIFLDGKVENGCWFQHVKGWLDWHRQDPEHILWLTYEDLCDRNEDCVRRIAKFVGCEVEDSRIAEISSKCNIASMKSDRNVTHAWLTAEIRKGGVGGWRNYFTVSQNTAFDECYRQRMTGINASFNFGEGLFM
mmetsp:Transcript_30048/g.72160  ORF Transcript_30048/g.72160 Transcript_30048/m.72160 type:complete len:386 (-) Transcript_30048:145-1302(-)